MATCNYVSIISPSECIGDSLFKINTNFNNLNSVVCQQETSIESLSALVTTDTPYFRLENNLSELTWRGGSYLGALQARDNLGLGTAALYSNQQLVRAWGAWLDVSTSSSFNIDSMSYSDNIFTVTFPTTLFETPLYSASISIGEFFGGAPQVNRPYIATIVSQTRTQIGFRIWQIEPSTGVPTLVTDLPSRITVAFYGGGYLSVPGGPGQ